MTVVKDIIYCLDKIDNIIVHQCDADEIEETVDMIRTYVSGNDKNRNKVLFEILHEINCIITDVKLNKPTHEDYFYNLREDILKWYSLENDENEKLKYYYFYNRNC